MAATIKDVSDFFKTGDPTRDSLAAFKNEWLALSDEEREYFKSDTSLMVAAMII